MIDLDNMDASASVSFNSSLDDPQESGPHLSQSLARRHFGYGVVNDLREFYTLLQEGPLRRPAPSGPFVSGSHINRRKNGVHRRQSGDQHHLAALV